MGKSNDIDQERWVEDRMAPFAAPIDWQPDIEHGLALLNQGREAVRIKRRKRVRIFGATVIAMICVLAFPVTRVLAGRCVGACVAGANQFSTLILYAFSSPADSETSLNELRGAVAPDFTAVDNSGATVRLSDFRGKVIVLNFWATWCPPCTHEIPWFVEFQQKYGDAGLAVVGISLDDDGWKSVSPFLLQMGVNYPVIMGDKQITRLYGGMNSLPATVIVDRSGRVAANHVGLISHDDFESGIRAMLNLPQQGVSNGTTF